MSQSKQISKMNELAINNEWMEVEKLWDSDDESRKCFKQSLLNSIKVFSYDTFKNFFEPRFEEIDEVLFLNSAELINAILIIAIKNYDTDFITYVVKSSIINKICSSSELLFSEALTYAFAYNKYDICEIIPCHFCLLQNSIPRSIKGNNLLGIKLIFSLPGYTTMHLIDAITMARKLDRNTIANCLLPLLTSDKLSEFKEKLKDTIVEENVVVSSEALNDTSSIMMSILNLMVNDETGTYTNLL